MGYRPGGAAPRCRDRRGDIRDRDSRSREAASRRSKPQPDASATQSGDHLRRAVDASSRRSGRGRSADRSLPANELHHRAVLRLAADAADDDRVRLRAVRSIPRAADSSSGWPTADEPSTIREDRRRRLDGDDRRGAGRAGAGLRRRQHHARLGRLLRGDAGRQSAPGLDWLEWKVWPSPRGSAATASCRGLRSAPAWPS